MSKRIISVKSGKEEIQMEVTEEEYQKYYRPWWQQKKREQRNRNAMDDKGYTEESYEAWKENSSENMGIPDCSQPDMDKILEKKLLLDVLGEAMETLLPDEKELISKVFKDGMSVCEAARLSGENRRTMAFRKDKILEKLRAFFRDRGFDV